MTAVIPFSELIPGHNVRVTDDTPPLIWAVDLVMAVTSHDQNYAGQILRNLVNKGKFSEDKLVLRNYPGTGNLNTRLVSFQDALTLVFVLPGKRAESMRLKAADILTRYFAGDSSLVDEIQSNAESDAPLNQLARAALGKRKSDVDELETQERKSKISLQNAQSQQLYIQMYTNLCSDVAMDERARLMFKDNILNMAGASKVITNGSEDTKPITISTVASGLGLTFTTGELQSIGVEVKNRYSEKYKAPPPKHDQLVLGAVRKVCSYTERDRDLIEDTLRDYARGRRRDH